jgi:glucan 1,3-beta-glucosidase
MEEGSGGFLNDLVVYGGEYGFQFGNQQYTMRNLTVFNAKTAIQQIWNWGWTYKTINVYNCEVGLNMNSSVIGSVTLLDSTFSNTTTAIVTGRDPATQKSPGAGSFIMENVAFNNVSEAVTGPRGVIIKGNTTGSLIRKGYANVRLPPSLAETC